MLIIRRYILQIRYGCQSKTCNTATCFSCRRRLAGAAPVRRYNATSARTLAVYMASQDNPEQGLCHHASAVRPFPEATKPPKSKNVPTDLRAAPAPSQDSRSKRIKTETLQTSAEDSNTLEDSERKEKQARRKTSMETATSRKPWPDLTALEEPAPVDHRSFIQNVFGTVAFKMLEWLTPRNLDLLSKSDDKKITVAEDVSLAEDIPPLDGSKETQSHVKEDNTIEEEPVPDVRKGDSKRTEPSVQDGNDSSNAVKTGVEHLKDKKVQKSLPAEILSEASSVSTMPTKTLSDLPMEEMPVPKSVSQESVPKRPSSLRKKTDPLEPVQKGLMSRRTSESMAEITPTLSSHGTQAPRRKMSRQTLITSPKMHIADAIPTLHELNFVPPKSITEVDSPSLKDDGSVASQYIQEPCNTQQNAPKEVRSPRSPPERQVSLPQSLSYLSIEIIEFICDIMQADGTCENHFLQPQGLDESLKRRREKSVPLSRDASMQRLSRYPSSAKQKWRSFIEQSLFDVLSRPEPLLRSFSNDESRLFDTQTIWYLMLRITRVAPSLVFDSLWNLAGTLFKPPQKLEATYEWARELQSQDIISQKALANHEAAQVINICLHALVAAAPLVSDPRQLANMSRIRSYGLAMLGREASSLEPATLCLHYEDAFTNDLALRLARRLFAAISTRRRFTELLNLQIDIRNDEKPQPDVLETVLGTLKFLDLGTPPVISFPDGERDLHEKRVPTLILDWARTVMLQDWEGAAQVPSDGPFGGALATMAAICKSSQSSFTKLC